jgi:predicted ATP-dependent serine protease
VISSLRSRVVPSDAVLIGEIGLTGHVQGAPQMAARIREARQLGFETVVAPAVKGEADPAVRPIARVAELEERLGWPRRRSALEEVEDA